MSKRGPSALGTDLRDRRPPLQRASSSRTGTSPTSTAARSMKTTVDSVLQYNSEIPSAQSRYAQGIRPRRHSNAGHQKPAVRVSGQLVPSRTTKISEKLVIIPATDTEDGTTVNTQEHLEERLRHGQAEDRADREYDLTGELRGDTWAERLGKAHRGEKLARLTAYCTAQSMKMTATADFIKMRHDARTKLYDDCLYVVYRTPLLPGMEGYRIRSRPPLMHAATRKSLLELMIERGERHDHYEHDPEMVGTPPDNYSIGQNGTAAPTRRSAARNRENPEVQIDTERLTIASPPVHDIEQYAEMFVFSYGVVVFWNFSERQERDILADLTFAEIIEKSNELSPVNKKPPDGQESSTTTPNTATGLPARKSALMNRPLSISEVETEEFHFQHSDDVKKPRVFNDLFTLTANADHMVKLTISHAIAQSTKLCYFEERMSETMMACQNIPKTLSKTGELKMTRTQVLRMMGRLYKNRVDINLSSNVLDVPNFFWDSEPVLQPLYDAIREYLEIDPRIQALNSKSTVFLDLASMLSDSVADTKMSNITIIIILLIVVSLIVTITELTMRFNLLQKSKGPHQRPPSENDPFPGDDDDPLMARGGGMREGVRKAAYQLVGMTLDQRAEWVRNLTMEEKGELCGEDVICRTFAGV